jgi:hypothetical protein
VVPNQCTIPLFDDGSIDIFGIGHHYLIHSIEPDLIGKRNQLAPLPLRKLQSGLLLICGRWGSHLSSGELVAGFCCQPKVLHAILDELAEVILQHQHTLIAVDHYNITAQRVTGDFSDII